MRRVRSLHMSPADDAFVSSGDDATVRLWDLRTPVCRVCLCFIQNESEGMTDD
jgi:COMPASS component SWD2